MVGDGQDERKVVLDDDQRGGQLGLQSFDQRTKASASRCATPAVGSSRQMTRGATARSAASSTIRRVPVESSAMKRSAYRPRPRKSISSRASA